MSCSFVWFYDFLCGVARSIVRPARTHRAFTLLCSWETLFYSSPPGNKTLRETWWPAKGGGEGWRGREGSLRWTLRNYVGRFFMIKYWGNWYLFLIHCRFVATQVQRNNCGLTRSLRFSTTSLAVRLFDTFSWMLLLTLRKTITGCHLNGKPRPRKLEADS